MKKSVIALAALLSVSAFATDQAKLRTEGNQRILELSNSFRLNGVHLGPTAELVDIMLNAPRTIKVSAHGEATTFKGDYVSGISGTLVQKATQEELTIETTVGGTGDYYSDIKKDDSDDGEVTYTITGDAAQEIWDAAKESGLKVVKPHGPSKNPASRIGGENFFCSANPLGGMRYSCTITIKN